MNLFLNERSLVCPGKLNDHWEAIMRFTRLIGVLKAFGLDHIICPKGYKNLPIGGITLAACYSPSDMLTADRRNELISLMNSSLREVKEEDVNISFEFSEKDDFLSVSLFWGNAYALDLPVVSLTCDKRFETDKFNGFFRRKPNEKKKAVVRNLYRETEELPVSLASFPLGAKKRNAEKEAMWNVEIVREYLSRIGHLSQRKRIFSTTEEKQAYLIKHAKVVALLNGWAYHSKISALNSRKGALRYIFYSAKFRQTDTYLSIDLEHEEIRFELCDYNGCHLKEIRWDGTVTDAEPKSNHNIMVHGK